MSLPTITVAGNVQRIEMKQTQSGKNIASVTVACGEKNSKGEWDNLYIKAEFWEKDADFVSKYFNEGSAIMVTGKLVTTNYTKDDGSKVYETKFQFPRASFVPKDKDAQAPSQPQYQAQPQPAPQPTQNQQTESGTPIPEIDINSDEIPF